MFKRAVSVIAVCALLLLSVIVGFLRIPMKDLSGEEASLETISYDKESVYIWYTDDSLTNYINSAAVAYNELNNARVVPSLKSPLDFLEGINASTIEADVPDLYILSHDALQRAYKAGLADEISISEEAFDNAYLGQSKNSVSYKGKLLAYPMYFETSTLLYNESYLEEMAVTALNQEKAAALAEAEAENSLNSSGSDTSVSSNESASEDADSDVTSAYSEEEIAEKIQTMLPNTIEDILTLANDYDAPEGVEIFFNWDVNDIFYNYCFIGDAVNLGGEDGSSKELIDVYNEDAIRALTEYQELNQFFSIDTDESDYGKIIQDFIDGKIIFTIATSDVVNTLEAAKEDGSFSYDYGLTLIPDLSSKVDSRTMSVTEGAVINPFSRHLLIANDFAYFLTYEYSDNLYLKSGKVSNAKKADYYYPGLNIFALEYGYSAPLPKIMEISNFWIDLEKTFREVWNGEDANKALKSLAEQLIYQVNKEETELEVIEIPIDEEEDEEYLDEAALINEALSNEDE